MFFRGRGTTYLAERDNEGVTGPAVAICQDVLTIALATESGEHINKCGPVDSPDARYIKSSSGTVSLNYADVADKNFAIGVLGKLNAASSPGTVDDEVLPAGLAEGDVYFLGGLERHRAITALAFEDSDSPPNVLVAGVDDDYVLDAATGRVTFGDLSGFTQPLKASYGHTDPKDVALLAAAQKQYILFFEGINLMENNEPTSLELYNVRFDPAQNIDFLSEDLQVMELQGSMLTDPAKPIDSDIGQFGRRVG